MCKEIIECNQETLQEWSEIGGVLGYDYDTRNVFDVILYIMDDGEFEDVWREKMLKGELPYPDITKEDFARYWCRSSLENAGYCDEEIELLMDW